MEAKKFRNVILFMANHWDKRTAIEIFGEVMGMHFWSKWRGTIEIHGYPDLGTMRLFYDMGNKYMQILLDYIEANYNG